MHGGSGHNHQSPSSVQLRPVGLACGTQPSTFAAFAHARHAAVWLYHKGCASRTGGHQSWKPQNATPTTLPCVKAHESWASAAIMNDVLHACLIHFSSVTLLISSGEWWMYMCVID